MKFHRRLGRPPAANRVHGHQPVSIIFISPFLYQTAFGSISNVGKISLRSWFHWQGTKLLHSSIRPLNCEGVMRMPLPWWPLGLACNRSQRFEPHHQIRLRARDWAYWIPFRFQFIFDSVVDPSKAASHVWLFNRTAWHMILSAFYLSSSWSISWSI